MLKLCTRFLLTNVCKNLCMTFFILFRSWVICKNLRDLISTHLVFIFLLITQKKKKKKKKKKQPKKSPKPFCENCSYETGDKFQQKVLNYMVIKLHVKVSSFSEKYWKVLFPVFSEITHLRINLGIRFFYHLIITIKL